MNLSIFDRNRTPVRSTTSVIEEDGNTLRVVEESTSARRWEPILIRGGERPAAESSIGEPVTAKAEIQAKRFFGNRMSEDRYAATITAADGSPNALIAALGRAFSEIDEFRMSQGPNERVILQVSLVL
jgi:hypothetical protein